MEKAIMINIFNTNKIASELFLGQMTNTNKIKYFIVSQILANLILYDAFISYNILNFSLIYEFFATTVIIGILFYKLYTNYPFQNFIEKIIILSLPINIKIFIFSIIVSELYVYFSNYYLFDEKINDLFWLLFGISITLIFFQRMFYYFKKYSNIKECKLNTLN